MYENGISIWSFAETVLKKCFDLVNWFIDDEFVQNKIFRVVKKGKEVNTMNLIELIESRKSELFDLLSSLIKIDSQSSCVGGNEKEICEYIAKEIEKIGYTPDVYSPLDIPGMTEHPDFWPLHNLKDSYNVSVVIPGKDRTKRLMLAAHTDTVAIGDRNNWTVDPLGGEIKDGKIWGRGACDDKYAVATGLFLIKLFKEEGLQFPCDVVFTAYCNEEYGGSHGALAACLKYPCDDVINMDCKDFEIYICAVGGEEMRAHIKAKEPVDDCGAMFEGLRILKEEFAKFRENRYRELCAHPEYADTVIPDESVRFLEMKAGNCGSDLDRASVEVCYYASSSKEEIEEEFAEMAKRIDKQLQPLGLEFDHFEKETRFFHFGKTAKENHIIDKLMKAAENATDRKLTPCGSCQSDLSIFLKYGSPRAISFGAGGAFSAYGGAHQTDEHIECDRLLDFAKIIAEFFTMQ